MGVMERKWRRGSRSIHRYAHTLLHMKSVLLIIQANQGSLIIKSFFQSFEEMDCIRNSPVW